MLYNQNVLSDTSPSVNIYNGNQGRDFFLKEGQKLKSQAEKELKDAEQLEEKSHKLNLTQGMNELANNDALMSNPQALSAEMDKLAKSVVSNIQNNDMKINILTDFELAKGSYINKATANMKRIQAENTRSATYDSIYKNINSIGASFGNAISGSYDENDIANFQYSLANLRKNINARNIDGTYMFSDAQRRSMSTDADKYITSSFLDAYAKLPEASRMAVASKLENDYFKVSLLENDGFKYKGTIDLNARPVYRNKDGSVSTEVSKTFEIGGKHIILPTITTENGKRVDLTDDQAVELFRETGLHLGIYDSGAEAEKAAQKIHERGEKGVDLRDIVGDTAYNDIKRSIGNYEALLMKEQEKARKAERDYRVTMFSKNPTGVELEALKREYPDLSDKTFQRLDEIWKKSPNYAAVTKDWQVAQDAIMKFIEQDFNEDQDQDRIDSYLGAVSDIRTANANGLITAERMQAKLDELATVMRDKEALDVYRNIKPYYNSVLSTLEKMTNSMFGTDIFSQSRSAMGFGASAWKEKRIRNTARDFLKGRMDTAFEELKNMDNSKAVDNFRLAMKKAREELVGVIDPNLAGLSEGQIFSINGIPHKYLGVSNNGDVLVEKVK